jgi:AcrR family transcriptional regulator
VDDLGASTGVLRAAGTRIRAGNTMGSTRAVVLTAALRLLAERGARRTSMTDIAVAAGIAKGTLYNHFRTKDEILAALLTDRIRALAAECAALPLPEALELAARRLAEDAAVQRLAAENPAVAHPLAAQLVSEYLAAAGRDTAAADVVLRWLGSHLGGRPSTPESARLLAAMLPARPPPCGRA